MSSILIVPDGYWEKSITLDIDSMALYHYLLMKALKDHYTQVYATNNYLRTELGCCLGRIKKARAVLTENGLIETLVKQDPSGHVKCYIKILGLKFDR